MKPFYTSLALVFGVGLYCVCTKKSLIKIVIGLKIMEAAVLTLLIASVYRPGSAAPLIVGGDVRHVVDPLPQAMALTAIVIGACTTAFLLSLVIKLHVYCGSTECDAITLTHGEDE